MDDTNASSPAIEPSHSEHAPVLHWSLSVVLLSLACAAAAWLSAMGATWGKSHDDAGAMTFALILLLGIDPFFMRRNHYFTPGGLVIVAGAGIAIAALSWLFRFNMIVFVWIGMTWALMSVAKPTQRGKLIAHQIDLEKATRTSWLNTKTEQSERMLVVYDFLTMLLVGFLLLAAWDTFAADSPPAESCDVQALMDKQDFTAATTCVKAGAAPNVRDKAGRGPLNRLLWYGRGLSVLDDKTLPFIEALVDAGADLNYRPPNQEASAFEALLEDGVHITVRPLMRRMLLREKDPVDLNASVSMRRSPPHDKRRLTPLLWAIKVGDVEIAALLLKRGADPNQIPSPGMGTPLHHAVHYNQPEIIRLLHQHGADIRTVSPSPILDSVNNGNTETTPETLRAALELGVADAIKDREAWLLHALSSHAVGKPLNASQFALLVPHLRINFAKPESTFLERLLKDYRETRRNFVHSLAAYRAAFLHALQSGANPNGSRSDTKAGNSLLQLLVTLGEGDLALEKALLGRGADPNQADKDGDTPLHQVAIDRNELKAQLAMQPEDPTAEIRIPEINSFEQLGELLRYVAGRPDRVDAMKPPLIRISIENRLRRLDDLERLLLAHGADATLKNRKGQTPRDIEAER
jgi:ankyrin repeat protein